ncbi:MAG: DUF3109 family protein [Prevotella sp.]|nr:DUF3109 family protein [Prevotella sp.]
MIVEIGNVLVTTELFSERFCCDLSACKGACCIEGDAGAPVKTDEIAALEEAAETIESELSPAAKDVIGKQGVVYIDRDGDLVTSIINGRECVFSRNKDLTTKSGEITNCRLCLLEQAYGKGLTKFPKPMSCALYPLREKQLPNGMTALNYNKWEICRAARKKGARLDIPLYKFLRGPLTRRFGEKWVKEMEDVARNLPAEYLEK